MKGEPELSTDAIIDELTALSARELCDFEVMPVKRGGRLSEDLNAVKLGQALGVTHAVRRIEEMRRKASVARYDAMRGRPGLRKRGGDV